MNEREIFTKLSQTRVKILSEYPFFGRLLLKLKFGLSDCETAFTDMRRIVFDPAFAERLSDRELEFVLIHEVLHCALKHCTRGKGKQHLIYNIACDIVVNSTIMEMYGTDSFTVDTEQAMHLAPNGIEGREYTAEEIYSMLMKMSPKEFLSFCEANNGGQFDNHKVWDEQVNATLEELWDQHVKEAAAVCSGGKTPTFMRRYLKEIDHTPRANWRQLLHDFIRFDKSDYDFTRPDKRHTADVLLPSFCEEADGAKIENLWFLVDTSGSVSDEALTVAFSEIKQATEQIANLSGKLFFFDHAVSDPIPFESLDDIIDAKPIGGGGTSFRAIFDKLYEYAETDDRPSAMVIITDGYADFPDEDATLGVPVIWIIVDTDVVPPWGVYAYIGQ